MSGTTYHISYNSCFSYCLVLFVPIYRISHLLESGTRFSIVIPLGRFSYHLPMSGPSISVVFVLATPLSYICHLFTLANSTMYLCQVSCHLLVSATFITYGDLLPKKNTRLSYSYQLLLCSYEISLLLIATLSGTPIKYLLSPYYTVAAQTTPHSDYYQLLLPSPINYSYHLLVTSSRYYSLLYQLLLLTSHFGCYFR